MEYNSLRHHGVKGMKWGVRRYRNKDGSLTPAGKKRLERDRADNNDPHRKENPDKWVRDDIRRSKGVVDAGSTMVRELDRVNNNSMKNRSRNKMDLSSMTDKEMRDQINRAMLERQYNDIFAPQTASRGREYASKTLEVAGSVLAIGSSALGIALAIKELRG